MVTADSAQALLRLAMDGEGGDEVDASPAEHTRSVDRQAARVAGWLALQPGPVLLCLDGWAERSAS